MSRKSAISKWLYETWHGSAKLQRELTSARHQINQLRHDIRMMASLPPPIQEHQELAAIKALCVEAGMTPESTVVDYLRGVFYLLRRHQASVKDRPVPPTPPEDEDPGREIKDGG